MSGSKSKFKHHLPQTMKGLGAFSRSFTTLYSDVPATLSNYVSSTITLKQMKSQLSRVYEGTANYLYKGGKKSIKEVAKLKKGDFSRIQKLSDISVENLRQNYRFIVESSSAQALASVIAVASIASLALLPVIDLIPCITTLGLVLGVSRLPSALSYAFDKIGIELDPKIQEAITKFAHDAAKTTFSMMVHARLAVVFTAMISTTIAGGPITCAIIATFLASIATAAIVLSVEYGEKVMLPRDIRNMLYDSPRKECIKLLKSKQKYLEAAKHNLTKAQIKALEQEIYLLQIKAEVFELLEKDVKDLKSQLADKKLKKEDQDILKAKLSEASKKLYKAEKQYFTEQEKKSLAHKLLPKAVYTLIARYCKNFYMKMVLNTVVQAFFRENLHITPYALYSSVRDKLISTFLTCQSIIQDIVASVTPEFETEKTKFLNIVLDLNALEETFIDNISSNLHENIIGPVQKITKKAIIEIENTISYIINAAINYFNKPSIEVREEAEELVKNIVKYAASDVGVAKS